jgi:hypothetical protein
MPVEKIASKMLLILIMVNLLVLRKRKGLASSELLKQKINVPKVHPWPGHHNIIMTSLSITTFSITISKL